MPAPRDYKIAALDRALSVLEYLGESPGQGVSEIAASLQLNKSQVFRMLQTLEARGFVARCPRQATYALGFQMSALGARAGGYGGLVSAATPVMERVRDETAENVNLLVREGQRALVIASCEGHHAMRLFAQAGRSGPLHAGGASTLLLAYAPTETQSTVLSTPLEAFTTATCTNPKAIKRRLSTIRSIGHYVSQDEFEEGAFSIAAPIRGQGGDVVAALSVAGATARLDGARRKNHTQRVLSAADDISRRIGHTDPGLREAS